ncbi:MAG: TIGR00730 family Rossman fold protein, partial [Candidatus Cryptobacteroides sp.]|nr:TIGR00730 family Rossman fold protein [Candidatus Cryptobacteroides sp.]
MGKQVVIFCASSNLIDPKYNEAARKLVRGLHAKGYDIVSGGGDRGTMGAITDESIRVGGRHVAVLPRFMAGMERKDVSEVLWTDTMSQRKDRM